MMFKNYFRNPLVTTLAAGFIALFGPMQHSVAAPLGLQPVPLAQVNTVRPNLIFTFDDSGSMAWAYMPDGISGDSGQVRGCGSEYNRIYYDPTRTYDPPVKEDGTPLNTTATTFGAAYRDGYNTGSGTVNLGTNYEPSWGGLTSYGTCGQTTPSSAFYFNYSTACGNPSSNACYTKVTVTAASAEAQNFANWYSYYRTRNLLAKTAAGRAFSQIRGNGRLAYQRLNSCNGMDAANPGLGSASNANCPGTFVKDFSVTANRTAFFNWLYTSPANGSTPLVPAFWRAGQYIGLAANNDRNPFTLNPGTAGTATNETQHSCRQNFHIAFTDGLWNNSNYGSGIQNGGIGGNRDNTATATLPTNGGTYIPESGGVSNVGSYDPATLPANAKIYPDGNSDYLADNAFYYWARDARTDLTNNVPQYITDRTGSNDEIFWNPRNDPARWQHLVNFTVGMGITGNRNFPGDYNALLRGPSGTPPGLAWGNNVVDDLWHAAVNSRGQYFNATNAGTLADSLAAIINDIGARAGSASGLAANSGSLSTNTAIFQARYQTAGWAGQLFAYAINPTDGTINTTPVWDAAEKLRGMHWDVLTAGQPPRTILTYDAAARQGKPFRWANLNTAQQGFLNTSPITLLNDGQGAARLEYLRGSSQNEGTGNDYRKRVCYNGNTTSPCPNDVGRLGDVVHSSPIFVGPPNFLYPETLETGPTASYANFRTAHQSRVPMLFFGANDGMLHGVNACTVAASAGGPAQCNNSADFGREILAYVPNMVMSKLNALTSPSYGHDFFVDGTPTVGDVFIQPRGATGPEWRTVLISGLRGGGKGYFALDITDPSSFVENAAAADDTKVLWEFTDPDLGYTFSRPIIAKMANGKWAAIFGNGYNNSGTGRGYVYIVFISDGVDGFTASEFVKLDTGVGSAATPNGVATPAVVDLNGDYIADFIYAGDLAGNMWRFDVSSTNPNNWTNNSNRFKLFEARNSANNPQPITTKPSIAFHPAGLGGLMVYFGSGKYLETVDNDATVTPPQTFFGVWDKMTSSFGTVSRSDLLQQTISTDTVGTVTVRTISDNAITWRLGNAPTNYLGWYINLPTQGERSIADSFVLGGSEPRVVFSTYIPTSDACVPGGSGWLMEVDLANGGRLDTTFDVDGNGVIDSGDQTASGATAAGIQITGGGLGTPIVLSGPATTSPGGGGGGNFTCQEYKYTSSATGEIVRTQEACTRQALREGWQQLK